MSFSVQGKEKLSMLLEFAHICLASFNFKQTLSLNRFLISNKRNFCVFVQITNYWIAPRIRSVHDINISNQSLLTTSSSCESFPRNPWALNN